MAEKTESLSEKYVDYVESFFGFFVDPNDRLFVAYLFSSLIIAFILYRKSKSSGGFLRFIFPKSVWNNPSAWLDVRYFVFHGLIGHFAVHILTAGAFVLGLSLTINVEILNGLGDVGDNSLLHRSVIAVFVLIIMTIVVDFIAFYLHYLQHKVPILWQFHKVHHSSEVMHPSQISESIR